MNSSKPVIKVSVRNLVEFILRHGDIDSGFAGSKRAVEGTRIHRKIQKGQKSNYEAEVAVSLTRDFEDFSLTIDGRIDGIAEEDGKFCIDEIKSITEPIHTITENYDPLHWAQVCCYGYMYSVKENIPAVDLRLIYCEVETEKIQTFTKRKSLNELESFFLDLIKKYEPWARFSFEWIKRRNETLRKLAFPFQTYRAGQRELAVAVYKSIKNKTNLFAKAPTGTGKTISTLFPALKAMGEELTSKIFYLTAKTITRTVAEEALSQMRMQDLELKYITLTAKEKICFKEKSSCRPEVCEYANGHFDRINEAIRDIIHNQNEFKRPVIEEYAIKHKVCPFEFALDISLWCDVIIGDYNYVFDPRVYLKRFFYENGGDYTFLIDEAHNLVERSREMFSAQIEGSAFSQEKKLFKTLNTGVYKQINKVQTRIRALGKLCDNKNSYVSKDIDEKLCNALRTFIEECEQFLVKNRGFEDENVLQLYFDALVFIRVSELFDSRYLLFVEKVEKNITVKLFCVDPSFMMNETLKRGKSSIFFSATLAPLPYYREMLGGGPKDALITLSSPFNVNNRCFLVAHDVSTKYQNRDQSVMTLVDYLSTVIKHKTGNYLAFFPSYKYLNSVLDLFREKNPMIKIIVQSSSMSEEERDQFLENFKADPQETVLGFCVLGGLFSEGIDLKNDRLIGTMIIGVGLPQICTEREIIRDYFQIKNKSGYDYAYLYPGMNKVMQAAGRVIRSEQDRGVILLIDERYTTRKYQSLFPAEWFPHRRVLLPTVDSHIRSFWSE